MKILIVGSGGREHALVWKISQSRACRQAGKKADKIYCAPGNAGIAQLAECVNLKADDILELKKFAVAQKIDLTIVGPEAPLAAGIVDEFKKDGLKIFGPSKAAAQLEGSKVFAKKMMKKFNVPTADFAEFTDEKDAIEFLQSSNFPIVIKADGLAAGKGVVVARDFGEAEEAVHRMLVKKEFGEASSRIIIEECLVGQESSILAFSDGRHFTVMQSAQDHKRIFDNDMGPNTGGMGAYSPAPVVTDKISKEVEDKVFRGMIEGMRKEGAPFVGVLYAGIMITKDGPKVLEFNVRFGDPETQPILMRLKTDLIDIIEHILEGKLDKIRIEWDKRAAVCVVLASGGYPGEYERGKEIFGLDDAKDLKDAAVFHSGTALKDGKVVTSGGRVLGVTAMADTIASAINRAYSVVHMVKFDNMHYRSDIGRKALEFMVKSR
ncbi:MAG: phosphoribosylamine--glycine ligase [bacterium]